MIVVSERRSLDLHVAGEQNNPFVGWDNLAASATLGGTATVADGARSNAVSGTTYDYWVPNVTTSEAVWSADFGAPVVITLAAIAAHNLADLGASCVIERSADGATWVDGGAGAVTPSEDQAIAWRMAGNVAARYWRLRLTGLTSGDRPAIGVIWLGRELILPDRTMSNAAPAIRPTEVQLRSNVSVGGNLLGSDIVARGSTVSLSLSRVPVEFVRGDLVPFIDHFNAGRGFIYGWRPSDYPTDLHWCWRDGGTLRPTHTGVLHLMSVEWEARAYAG